jgi:putative PEP-CTERM system histidine kinase
MSYYFAIIGILGLILCAGLGLFTLLKNPRHLANIGFTLGLFSLAVIEAGCALVMLSPFKEGFAHAGARILLSGMASIPASWLLFSVVFARANQKEVLARWAPAIVLCAAASLFFILKSGSLFEIHDEVSLFSDGTAYYALSPLGRYLSVYLILGSVVNLVHLENTLRSSSGSKRWHIKYLIFGVGSVLAYFIYLSSQSLLFSSLGFETVPLTAAVILVSTSMMAVFIVKHRLLDVDIFISRYVIYNSLTVLVVGLYLFTVGIIAAGIRYFQVPFGYFLTTLFIFTSVLLLVIFLFTTSLRRKAQLFINKHFYKHKYEFRDKWMETIEKISRKRSVSEIRATLRDMISETTGAKPVYLWLYDPVTSSYQTGQEGVPETLKKVVFGCSFASLLGKDPSPSPFTVDEVDVNAPHAAVLAGIFAGTGTVLCTPLVADQEVIGFIMQGPDQSSEPYIRDDFEILTAMSTQAAVQIKNLTMAQELMAAKEVDTFSRISTFIMHDLKNLTNSLSLISQNAKHNMDNPEFRKDTIKTIDGTVSRMKSLIERLSSVPRGMELKRVETDMKYFIGATLKKVHLPKDKEVVIASDVDFMPPIYIDHEAVEMVILNLIVNAYDAIDKEGIIKVYAGCSGGSVNIVVRDNGSGISSEFMDTALFRPFKTTKKNGFGIGLYQCKTLIEAHGGSISVESAVGKGTSFTVTLPAGANPGKTSGQIRTSTA